MQYNAAETIYHKQVYSSMLHCVPLPNSTSMIALFCLLCDSYICHKHDQYKNLYGRSLRS